MQPSHALSSAVVRGGAGVPRPRLHVRHPRGPLPEGPQLPRTCIVTAVPLPGLAPMPHCPLMPPWAAAAAAIVAAVIAAPGAADHLDTGLTPLLTQHQAMVSSRMSGSSLR